MPLNDSYMLTRSELTDYVKDDCKNLTRDELYDYIVRLHFSLCEHRSAHRNELVEEIATWHTKKSIVAKQSKNVELLNV